MYDDVAAALRGELAKTTLEDVPRDVLKAAWPRTVDFPDRRGSPPALNAGRLMLPPARPGERGRVLGDLSLEQCRNR